MTDLENDEIIDGPRASAALEFGHITGKTKPRHNFWFRAFSHESPPNEGLIWKIDRRPRTRRNEDPHPTVRIMQQNPNGMLYAKVKSGEIRVENYHDFVNRMILMARDDANKEQKSKK